jgi:hypothetical protein
MTWAVASADAGLADANGPVSFIEQEWLRRAAAARSPRNGGASESSALWVKTAISSHTSPHHGGPCAERDPRTATQS